MPLRSFVRRARGVLRIATRSAGAPRPRAFIEPLRALIAPPQRASSARRPPASFAPLRQASVALLLPASLLLAAPAAGQGLFPGALSGDRFGAAVRAAGDLNGDGFADLVIGAPENDEGGANRGRVYVYFGRAQNVPEAPDLELFAGDGGDNFGTAVAGIGRFNGDRFDDLAVGAPNSDAGGAGRGRVYIFFGGDPMNTTADLILQGQQAGDHFGQALDGGVDFDNDGFDDLAVGSPDRPVNGLQSGEVRIFFGGSSPGGESRFLLGQAPLDQFGWAVRRAGDVNADGFGDLVVGAPQPFALNPGRATVLLGGPRANDPGQVVLTGPVGGDRFGWSVAGGDDVNNDGFDDVAVGAPRHDGGGSNNGGVYLFLGGSPMNSTIDAQVFGRGSGDELGTSVSLAGDFDGDGRADLAAGAPGSDDGGSRAGEINLWRGASPLAAGAREVFAGPRVVPGFAAEDAYGTEVDLVDYNGDGQAELLGGAPEANRANGDETGFASLHFFPGSFVPVTLLEFSIHPGGDRIRLRWRVPDDGEVLGFHVERKSEGAWRRRTPELLHGLQGRFEYEDTDPALSAGGPMEYRLVALLRQGGAEILGPFAVLNAPGARPWLGAGYPNPAPGGVRIPLVLPESTDVTLDIYDAAGRPVRRLHEGALGAGRIELWWDGTDDAGARLPAGSYYVRLEAPGFVRTRSVVVLR